MEHEDRKWKKIPDKRRKNRNVGTLEEETENFKGALPKVWLYLYKISPDVTEEDIKTFLKKRTRKVDENFIVKELNCKISESVPHQESVPYLLTWERKDSCCCHNFVN
ncbi:hypothetical protein JTB14_036999 [Gonioctena quinquepunctata]|nr:hypothetical protein JTB14_036999 [Gonioctena quinquepunctata]